MAVDWTVPQPSYEDLHARLDALQTERNAAVAEAALWKQRYFETLQELRDAQAERVACDKSHKEWEQAYAALLREFRRGEIMCAHLNWEIESLPPENKNAAVAPAE